MFLATNAIVKATGKLGYSSALQLYGGSARFEGGEAVFAGASIGQNKNQSSVKCLRAALVVNGKFTLRKNICWNYGSLTIMPSAASEALTIEKDADIEMTNLNLYQRNVYQNGGKLVLNGNSGVNEMGYTGGTARYTLSGGRLETCLVSQSTNDGAKAQFYFNGGTLANTQKKSTFFKNFSNSDSKVCVAGATGGTFEVNYDAVISVDLLASDLYNDKWNYTTADYMTAPAFRKTGDKTLTLNGSCFYKCATEVAEGTLKLSGENAMLPTSGVVRVTGGTLDLGGNAQKLRALCGTAGRVTNGSVEVTEGVYPGGAGTIGSFTNDVAIAGTLYIDVAEDGASDSLVTTAALDLSNIDLVVSAPETLAQAEKRKLIISGPYTGKFRSVSGLPAGCAVSYGNGRVRIGKSKGMAVLVY